MFFSFSSFLLEFVAYHRKQHNLLMACSIRASLDTFKAQCMRGTIRFRYKYASKVSVDKVDLKNFFQFYIIHRLVKNIYTEKADFLLELKTKKRHQCNFEYLQF